MVTNRLAALLTWTSNRFTAEQFEECVKETHSPNIQSIRGSKSKGGGGLKVPILNTLMKV